MKNDKKTATSGKLAQVKTTKQTKTAVTAPKKVDLSKALQQANELRLKALKLDNAAMRAAEKLVKKDRRQPGEVISDEALKVRRETLKIKVNEADKLADEAYSDYYNFVHQNFTPTEINSSLSRKGNFLDRDFINKLNAEAKKKR